MAIPNSSAKLNVADLSAISVFPASKTRHAHFCSARFRNVSGPTVGTSNRMSCFGRATFTSVQLCACVPNVRIMETDVDSVPWRDDLVTELPEIDEGHVILPSRPGWGTDLNEKELAKHPWPR